MQVLVCVSLHYGGKGRPLAMYVIMWSPNYIKDNVHYINKT